MALHFSKQEFEKRKLATLKSMKEHNLDALLMFRQESMFWLTGYDTFSYVFFQTLILDNKGDIILLTRAPDLRQAQNTSNIEDIRIWVDKDQSNPTDNLKIILNELNLKDKNKTQEILKLAVKRMLPGGPLAKKQLTKLKIYSGEKHPHEIQQPKVVEFEKLNKRNLVKN